MVERRGLWVNLLSALASHTRPQRVGPTFRRNRRSLNVSIVTEPLSNDELNPLWEPLELRATTVPNRVMCSATTLQYGNNGLLGDRHEAFYRERALGGVGLLFTEQLTASPLSKTGFSTAIAAYDADNVMRFAELTAALAEHPTRLFAQLVAGGGKGASTLGLNGWGPVRAPSRVLSPDGETPQPLEPDEIAQLVRDFARSARNLQEGGVHGIEVHGAHGWLVGQFLSPFYNRRDDGYGGTVEARCRLALEIGAAIRRAVGDELPVGLALTYDECIGPAGITLDQTLAQLEVLADAGIYDFFDLSIGAPHAGHLTISSMAVPENYAFEAAAAARRILDGRAAVFIAGRVTDLRMAARAVAAGDADVVAMTRAHLADPHLVRKARAGRSDETTRCVGANVCVGRALRGVEVACVVNPATGRERTWGSGSLAPAEVGLKIAVIGAGPAGLRVAATSAQRGHDVTVYEKESAPGGHLRELAWLPTRESWTRAVDDLVSAIDRHGGRLETRAALEAEDALSVSADVFVVATGATWDESGASARRPERAAIPGLESTVALGLGRALERARSDPHSLGQRVVIVDETGSYAPLGLAEVLAGVGTHVHLVTPTPAVGADAAAELELPHVMPRLRRLGVELIAWHDIESVEGRRVVAADVWGGRLSPIEEVDAIVLARERAPRDALFDELRAAGRETRLVGDARSPRTTVAVIHEAEALARAL
jgi:2,4-dienoyl-CoA reductase-like NADH-dependent reductase (Old Yellow Enzyme family)/thioredoxin reductase